MVNKNYGIVVLRSETIHSKPATILLVVKLTHDSIRIVIGKKL